MKKCSECGGEVGFDPELKMLVCSNCGEMFEEKFEIVKKDEETFL